MSNENHKPNYEGDRTVILPGGLPAIKEVEPKKPVVRMPQLSNADDIAAIHRNREFSAQIEPVLAGLRQLLIHNLPYVTVVRKFVKNLAAEIENPTPPDDEPASGACAVPKSAA